MSSTKLLQNLYLFKGLGESYIELLDEIAELKIINPGEDIFCEGDEASALYVIQFGSVRIHQKADSGEKVEVATLGTGSHFGEMAFIDGENRSASATGIEKSEIVVIAYENLNRILSDNHDIAVHFYRQMANFLCGRLRITTNDLSFARSQNLSHF